MIYPVDVIRVAKKETQPEVTMCTEVKNFLLDGSPGSTFTVISHEEVRAVMDVASTRNLMGELHVLLDRWKEDRETSKAGKKQDNAPTESHMAAVHKQGEVENHRPQDMEMKDHFLERMTNIKSYWKDLNSRSQKGYENTSQVISMLQRIEKVLKKVPRSHRDKLQARFSGLRAEVETIMESMMDRMKIQCDKKPSFFHELATSSQQCS